MSREKKHQMIWYQIDDSEAISRHLEKMARKGWLLEKVDNLYYTYRRCEPAEVRYAVTFFPDASYFDPGLIEGQETYVDYCQAAGWELAAFYGPIQYFRTADPDAPPIETDESVKLTSIRRTMRKSFLPTHIALLLLPLTNLPLLRYGPTTFFYSNTYLSLLVLMAGMLLFAVGMLGDYLIWLLRSRHAVRHGGSCKKPHTRFRLGLNIFMVAFCGMAVIGYVMDSSLMRGTVVIYLTVYLGFMLLARLVLRKLKEGNTERWIARTMYFAFAIIVGFSIGAGMPFLIFRLADAGIIHTKREPAETYVYVNRDGSFVSSWPVYYDTLPITLEDLGYTVTHGDHCSYEKTTERSFLAVHSSYTQRVLNFESDLPELYFGTYDSQWEWILEKSWEDLIARDTRRYEPWIMERIDPAPWGALEAFRQEGLTTYYLYYPNRIVTFQLGEEAAAWQLNAIAQALRP